MINFREIFKAWVISVNPSERQKELAEARLSICLNCEFKKEVLKGKKWSAYCKKCGCPIKKKIFSEEFRACPGGYWEEIDKKFGIKTECKSNNSII